MTIVNTLSFCLVCALWRAGIFQPEIVKIVPLYSDTRVDQSCQRVEKRRAMLRHKDKFLSHKPAWSPF